jgi:hypothetical protein
MKGTTDIVVPPFHVQSTAVVLKNGFPYFTHHDNISSLWAQKWRPPCQHGIYPFGDGNVADFDPIFQELIKISGDKSDILFQPDDYAAAFFPTAEQLFASAEQSEREGEIANARDLYLRAAAVYRIARFPINRSPLTQLAWERGKAAYLRGGRYLSPPNIAVNIAFTHADPTAGDQNAPIEAYLRIPKGEMPAVSMRTRQTTPPECGFMQTVGSPPSASRSPAPETVPQLQMTQRLQTD